MPAVLKTDAIEELKDKIARMKEAEQPTPVERAIDRQSKILQASVMIFAQEVSNAIKAVAAEDEAEEDGGDEYEFTVSAHRPGEAYTVTCKRIK